MSGAQPRHRLHVPSGLRFLPRPSLHPCAAAGDASQQAAHRTATSCREQDAGDPAGVTTPVPTEDDAVESGCPDVPADLRWSCVLTGAVLTPGARDQQLRHCLDQAGLPPTSFPRLASVLDDLLARLAGAGAQVERVSVECRSNVLLLLIEDAAEQPTALPRLDAPFLEVLALDHGQFCKPGGRCTWATLPCGAG